MSQLFPPTSATRAVQVYKILSKLHIHRFWPVIYCEDLFGGPDHSIIDSNINHCEVHRSPSLWRFRIFRYLLRLLPGLALDLFGVGPMAFPSWNAGVCFRSLFLNKKQFDLIFTISTPVADHVTGLFLKKWMKLPWVVFFSDPWICNPCIHPISYPYMKRHQAIKQKVLAAADYLIFPTEEILADELGDQLSQYRHKSCVIPHCFYPNFDDVSPVKSNAPAHKVIFRYVGYLNRARTPEALMAGIAAAKEKEKNMAEHCQFEFVGALYTGMKALRDRYQIGEELVEIPYVNYLESLGYMKGADVLVHLDRDAEINFFLASKLVEYIGARKPILGITPSRGTAADLIRKANGFVAAPGSPGEIADCILEIIKKKQLGQLDQHVPGAEIRNRYHVEAVAGAYAEVFRKVLAKAEIKTVFQN